MKTGLLWALAGLLLSSAAARAEDTVRAFGLEFTVISNAVMAMDDEFAALRVFQVGGPDCDQLLGSGSNDLANASFGISVHLGEAQSGVYIYPDANCRMDDRSMWGKAYGNVDGETNRLISFMKGTRVGWGLYHIEVDLTPLGATSYTYQVWSQGLKTMHRTNQGPFSGISTYNVEDYGPRVNPFFLSDGVPGAIIEFPRRTQFGINDCCSSIGDRFIIIAEGATNQVNYVSRVDVFGSENLPSFAVADARIGMFGWPHKALGGVNFTALSGRLTAGPFEGVSTDGPTNGVLVDFKNGAVRWSAQTEAFAVAAPDARFLLSASGKASDGPFDRYWGPVGFTRSNGVVHLFADVSGFSTSNSVLRVFRSNVLSGVIHGVSGRPLATLAETNPLVTGWEATASSLSFSIAEPTGVAGHEGTVLEGDRFEFGPHEAPVRIGYVRNAHVRVHGTAGFSIVSETAEEARAPELRIQIERTSSGLLVSWPAHESYSLMVRTNLGGRQVGFGFPYPEYRDFRRYLPVNPTNSTVFFSLQHRYWYYMAP
jgi:hypothetical protein